MPRKAYSARIDTVALKEFEAVGHDDRHRFRFIVSPEDAVQLEDLCSFARNVMKRTKTDLGTRLDWVAVDHSDADNAHTHFVLRSKDETGRDLVAPHYVAHGMRRRASELATEWLGARTEMKIRAGMQREADQERWTGLDQALQANTRDGGIDPTVMITSREVSARATSITAHSRECSSTTRSIRITLWLAKRSCALRAGAPAWTSVGAEPTRPHEHFVRRVGDQTADGTGARTGRARGLLMWRATGG